MVIQLCGPSLEKAFWTPLTMSSGCFHFPASGRRNVCARTTTSRWTTGPSAARRLCRSTDRREPGSSWQHAGKNGSPATASKRRWRRKSQPNAVVKIFRSAMIDPKMGCPWAWGEQAVESRARPASCDAISKSITYTIEQFLVNFDSDFRNGYALNLSEFWSVFCLYILSKFHLNAVQFMSKYV